MTKQTETTQEELITTLRPPILSDDVTNFLCKKIDELEERLTELHRAIVFGKLEKLDLPEHKR